MSAPTQYVASIAVDSVIEAIGAFIQPFVGSAQIIRAEVNRVAPPNGAYVELTELMQVDLEYPRTWYDNTYLQNNTVGPKRISVQADFYGPLSGDWCAAVKQMFRTPYAASAFPDGIAPLYTDEGHQAPLITGEEQYLRRWALTLELQYNPIVVIDAESANTLKMNIVQDVETIN